MVLELEMAIFFPFKCFLNNRNDMVRIIYISNKVI